MSEAHLYNNPPRQKYVCLLFNFFFWFYVFVFLTFIKQSILWAKIYDLVVHKTNEKKKHTKIKQDFDSRNKEKKAIRSVEHMEETKQWTPDAMREAVQNLY